MSYCGNAGGELDALVNCAGVFIPGDPITAPMAVWRKPMDIMLNGAVQITRVAVPLMTTGGRVIHVTSIHGDRVGTGAARHMPW